MSILAKIEAFFTGPVWTFLKPFVSTMETQGGPILIAAAESGVAAGFAATGGGSAAMATALSVFESQVVSAGVPFVESQARALIEVALQNAKTASIGTTTTAAAAVVNPPVA